MPESFDRGDFRFCQSAIAVDVIVGKVRSDIEILGQGGGRDGGDTGCESGKVPGVGGVGEERTGDGVSSAEVVKVLSIGGREDQEVCLDVAWCAVGGVCLEGVGAGEEAGFVGGVE